MGDRPLSRAESLELVRGQIAAIEKAIRAHPERTVNVYERRMSKFDEIEVSPADVRAWLGKDASHEECLLILRFLLASSFMTAWLHMTGDKKARNTATNSAVLFVSNLGADDIALMQEYVRVERGWRQELVHAGVFHKHIAGCLGLLLVVIALGIVAYFVL